ncbi:hypothetical protein BANRA_00013 [Escherichia coli]|nr:hypothetical protein BANRA_00013 [Escherichia coli]
MAVSELYTPRKTGCCTQFTLCSVALLRGRVEEILNGWNSPEAQLAEQALRSGHIEALINIWENDNLTLSSGKECLEPVFIGTVAA